MFRIFKKDIVKLRNLSYGEKALPFQINFMKSLATILDMPFTEFMNREFCIREIGRDSKGVFIKLYFFPEAKEDDS